MFSIVFHHAGALAEFIAIADRHTLFNTPPTRSEEMAAQDAFLRLRRRAAQERSGIFPVLIGFDDDLLDWADYVLEDLHDADGIHVIGFGP